MIDEEIKERFDLAIERIPLIKDEVEIETAWGRYCQEIATLFETLCEVLIKTPKQMSIDGLKQRNEICYAPIRGENYSQCFGNPTYAHTVFGKGAGRYLCYFYCNFRDAIHYAYFGMYEPVLIRMELFLELYGQLSDTPLDDWEKCLKEILYYYVSDYSEWNESLYLDEMLNPSFDYATRIVMESDFCMEDYLYQYGENITANETKMAQFLAAMSEEELANMASTYTEGFRQGFVASGIDLSKKKSVNIRYQIGFEPMVRQAIIQFEKMGLKPVLYCRSNTSHAGITSTPANRQYIYDHRYDDALYLNQALVNQFLEQWEHCFEEKKELASVYAGPAVIEIFGEELFVPVNKEESEKYSKKQEKLSVDFRRDKALIQNRFIPRDEYSFTIIAYPIPAIGPDFEKIFKDTVEVNTLDVSKYGVIQSSMIQALDQGTHVTVTGRGKNHTNLTVALHPLTDPAKETIFENCLADVNIPLGETFTSPQLHGTNGILHVTQVYLEGLRFDNLEMQFQDGMIADYNCSNFATEEENKAYIKENVMFNRETLPMGEFAIGTNTAAYRMGKRYEIGAKLPILIAEKTGPHFAVGDTCYSMSEEIPIFNPDGKEVIARDNECSLLRKTDLEKAYFNCHTDITIPYSELGDITVHTKNGESIQIISQGRFVLPGTESLNEYL